MLVANSTISLHTKYTIFLNSLLSQFTSLTHTQTFSFSQTSNFMISSFFTTSYFCNFLHLFHGCWLRCAREFLQYLLSRWKLHGVMESEKIQKSKIYLCAIPCECEHTLCHKKYRITFFIHQYGNPLPLHILSFFCGFGWKCEIPSFSSPKSSVPPKIINS